MGCKAESKFSKLKIKKDFLINHSRREAKLSFYSHDRKYLKIIII